MAMGMTDDGHIIHAKAMFSRAYHLAWGRLPEGYSDAWELGEVPPIPTSLVVAETVTRHSSSSTDVLSNTGVLKVLSIVQGDALFTETNDYSPNGNQISWDRGGSEPDHGSQYVVTYRYATASMTGLLQEIARRTPTLKEYVIEDPTGDIVANDSTWKIVEHPTRHVYFQFKFDATEAVGNIIHQVGLFADTVPKASIPVGQKYLLPSELESEGNLYMIDNLEPFSRFAGKREVFEYVITY